MKWLDLMLPGSAPCSVVSPEKHKNQKEANMNLQNLYERTREEKLAIVERELDQRRTAMETEQATFEASVAGLNQEIAELEAERQTLASAESE